MATEAELAALLAGGGSFFENYFDAFLAQKKRAAKEPKRLYIFEMTNGTIKIGVSKNLNERAKKICNSSGMKIRRYAFTPPLPFEDAFKIEAAAHKRLKEFRLTGEFFNYSFEKFCADFNSYFGTVFTLTQK